jgi:hypothetical protein
MTSSGMLRRVALVRSDISYERSTSIIRVTTIGELDTIAITNDRRTQRRNAIIYYYYYYLLILVFLLSVRQLLLTAKMPSSPIILTLMMEVPRSSEMSVLTRTTRRSISEDGILNCSLVCFLGGHLQNDVHST